ncbi:phage tail protein [Paenibacillus hunanensis]|uniref:Microcystin-dependent protein n=1 Tax=Paenibacillus hunanensis TaxID=539262 RepID=A0ABU1J302_9BACL|nr:tail fiber protein [Paenibacillus hunanensis]MDR6245868.1 microcystin-dependent protein [Paenibacillus hunanensis]
MAEPFVGEIRIFAFGVIPRGWIACNGQILQIRENQALFSLITNMYGGDGRTTFAVPDLRGRVPVQPGGGINMGQSAGEAVHVLTTNEMPAHNHTLSASSAAGTAKIATNNVMATTGAINSYSTAPPNAVMATTAISNTGASAAHNNMQPYLTVSYCIATTGIYPSRP